MEKTEKERLLKEFNRILSEEIRDTKERIKCFEEKVLTERKEEDILKYVGEVRRYIRLNEDLIRLFIAYAEFLEEK